MGVREINPVFQQGEPVRLPRKSCDQHHHEMADQMHDGSGALDVHEEPNDDLLIQSLRVKLNTLLITTNEREGLLTDLDLIQDNHNALREENSNLKKQNEELLTVLNKGLGTSTVGENGAIIPSSSVTLKPNHFIFPKNSGLEVREFWVYRVWRVRTDGNHQVMNPYLIH